MTMIQLQKYKWLMTFFLFNFSIHAESISNSSGSCVSDKSCVCITNLDEFVLHCEGDVHVTVNRKHEEGTFSCTNTLPPKRFYRNYHSLLQLNSLRIRKFSFLQCPQPSDSYASLFVSHLSNLASESKTLGLYYPIVSLTIDCGSRSEFRIERKNLQGMDTLKLLRIRCHSLLDLTNDLFHEPFPNLFYIEITGIRSDHIPDKFFSKLEKLEFLELLGSQVRRLQKNCLSGPRNLKKVNVIGNKIETIDDEIFYEHSNIVDIDLSKNSLKVIPASLESLSKLETLYLQQNFLRNFSFNDCSNFSNLHILNLKDNQITEINFDCLSQMYLLTSLDVSGNNILRLPVVPILMESLDSLTWNHNSARNIHLDKFLIAKSLFSLKLSNFSIISVGVDSMKGIANLKELDLSWNSIKSIPEEFFINNSQLESVTLEGNSLSVLPPGTFKNNHFLYRLNLKSNRISILDATIFAMNSVIQFLDISNNHLQEIPEDFLFDFERIDTLNFSFNHINRLGNKLFIKANKFLLRLDLSHNMLENLPQDIFLPLNDSRLFHTLNLQENKLLSLPDLAFPKLRSLNLAGNKLQKVPGNTFQKLPALEQLDLSRNFINEINPPFLSSLMKIFSLDLSSNQLKTIREYTFIDTPSLRVLNFSNNLMKRFTLESVVGAIKLHELDLSNNNMSYFGVYSDSNYRETVRRICFGISEGLKCEEMAQSCPIKVLNLSKNKLNFNYTQLKFNQVARTWGRISPLIYCKNVEVVYLNDNDIDEIFLDWRINFPNLQHLDLQRNKFKYLTHEEQLFSSVNIHENGSISPYSNPRPMVIDLQENLISSIELPTALLSSVLKEDRYNKIYRSTTFLLGKNPLACDCGLFNLLRVVNNDAALTGEVERRTGEKWMLPAKLDTNNLRCWLPASLKGKKIDEPEEWIHHLLPMLGLCSLQGDT